MRKIILALLAAGGIGLFTLPYASAAPANGAAINNAVQPSPVEQVRLYCRSNITGEFLYWGPCVQDRLRFAPVYRGWWGPRHHHHHW